MVGRNITILLKQEYDDVWIEYVYIMNTYVITKGDDAIDYVWSIYNGERVPDRKRGKSTNWFISEDDKK